MMTDETRSALERRAKQTKAERYAMTVHPAPLVIEFAGSPKAGKSTNIDILSHFFRRMDFKVWAPMEGASKRTPYNLKHDLVAFNTWSLNYAISELLVAYHNVDRHDVIILDRGPFDSLAWMGLLHKEGKLEEDEFDAITKFAMLKKWRGLISRVCLFTCTPEKSLERESATKLTSKHGKAMNTSMLPALLEQYNKMQAGPFADRIKPYVTNQTTGPLDTAVPIAEDILMMLEEQRHGTSPT